MLLPRRLHYRASITEYDITELWLWNRDASCVKYLFSLGKIDNIDITSYFLRHLDDVQWSPDSDRMAYEMLAVIYLSGRDTYYNTGAMEKLSQACVDEWDLFDNVDLNIFSEYAQPWMRNALAIWASRLHRHCYDDIVLHFDWASLRLMPICDTLIYSRDGTLPRSSWRK